MYRYAWHLLGSREDAEDATQSTFLGVHSALIQGTPVREPRPWVLKIARNECLRRIGARGPAVTDIDESAEPAAVAPPVERQVELRLAVEAATAALAALPIQQREAFVLREWCGLTPVEVGAALDKSVSSVDALIHRARSELVRSVGAQDGAASCDYTRTRIVDDALDRRSRAHLVRCKSCRAAQRLAAPRSAVVAGLVPPAAIGEALAATIPGFATALGGAASGGAGAATVAKVVSAPIAAKAGLAGLVAVTVAGGTVGAHAVREDARSSPSTVAVSTTHARTTATTSTPAVAASAEDDDIGHAPPVAETDDDAPARSPAPPRLKHKRRAAEPGDDRGGDGDGRRSGGDDSGGGGRTDDGGESGGGSTGSGGGGRRSGGDDGRSKDDGGDHAGDGGGHGGDDGRGGGSGGDRGSDDGGDQSGGNHSGGNSSGSGSNGDKHGDDGGKDD